MDIRIVFRISSKSVTYFFDERIAINTNAEVGGNDVNVHKDVINDDNELLGVSKVTTDGLTLPMTLTHPSCLLRII